MKQISDEVFAQVRDALRPFAEDAKYIHKDWSDERMRASLTQNTPLTVRHFRKAGEALAALDTAQPVPEVNAMLVEALQAAEKLEHEALVALSEATYELKVGLSLILSPSPRDH